MKTKTPSHHVMKLLIAVASERDYQKKKWPESPHSVEGWLLILEKQMEDARKSWVTKSGDEAALHEIRQIVATGFAALEEHGAPMRSLPPEDPLRDAGPQCQCGFDKEGYRSIGENEEILLGDEYRSEDTRTGWRPCGCTVGSKKSEAIPWLSFRTQRHHVRCPLAVPSGVMPREENQYRYKYVARGLILDKKYQSTFSGHESSERLNNLNEDLAAEILKNEELQRRLDVTHKSYSAALDPLIAKQVEAEAIAEGWHLIAKDLGGLYETVVEAGLETKESWTDAYYKLQNAEHWGLKHALDKPAHPDGICRHDSDGDGNCPHHPDGCLKGIAEEVSK